MTSLIHIIHSSTYDLTPSHLRFPPFIWTAFTALNQVHSVWRWYRRIELYRNPDNLAQLLCGHVINFVVGDALILRIAAQCLLISTRLLECVQMQASICRSGRSWISAACGKYPKAHHVKWKQQHSLWISPSTFYWCKKSAWQVIDRMSRIALSTYKILKKIFKLSMYMMDAVDAFYWSPSAKTDGITESFLNMTKWLNIMMDNKEELLNGITANQAIIERLLKNSPFTYSQLHQHVTKMLENTEVIYRQAKHVSTLGRGILKDFGKRLVNGSLVVVGMPSLAIG